MNEIIKKLHLKDIGLLEFLTVLYPILCGYNYGGMINLEIIVPVVLIVLVLKSKKKKRAKTYGPLLYLFIYIMLHNFVWIFVMPSVHGFFINTWILYILVFATIFIVAPKLELDKYIGCVNWVALICVGGMIYQASIVLSGGTVKPLTLPFMPALPGVSRAYWEVIRPSSFFWEPNAYVSFMMIPLVLSLQSRIYIWSFVIVVSMFLSTSTTGIVMSFVIIIFHIVSLRSGVRNRLVPVVFIIALLLLLTKTSYFEFGVDKLNNTDVTTDSRTANGPTFVFAMPASDLLLGGGYANTGDYYASGELGSLDVAIYGATVYMTSFWNMIALYGLVGLLFYMILYVKMAIDFKSLRPYILCLIIELFAASSFFGSSFCIEMLFVLCVYYNSLEKNKDSNVSLPKNKG